MTGEIWWQRMVNAVRFLDDIQYILESGKSVILNFPDSVPWADIMAEELGQRIARTSDRRTFKYFDVSDVTAAGKYLCEKFCKESDRAKYWPTRHGNYERFMAQNTTTPLNHYIVCFTGINSASMTMWENSVKEYLNNCTMEEHGLFVLVAQGANVRSSGNIECLQFSDYITDYDCMMLCLMLISSLDCGRVEKVYLAEAASNIAGNNIEIAGLLVSAGTELIKDPLGVTTEIFDENGIKSTRLTEKVNSGIWEAQIRLVFPRIEDFRSRMVQKYGAKLSRYLPLTNSINERIDKVDDLEIGTLFVVATKHKLMELSDYEMLRKMKDARNSLAHRCALSYNDITDLKIF